MRLHQGTHTQMASLAVTWVPSSNLWCTETQDLDKSTFNNVVSRKAYTTATRLVEFVESLCKHRYEH